MQAVSFSKAILRKNLLYKTTMKYTWNEMLMEKYPKRDYTTKALYTPKGSVVKSLIYPVTV